MARGGSGGAGQPVGPRRLVEVEAAGDSGGAARSNAEQDHHACQIPDMGSSARAGRQEAEGRDCPSDLMGGDGVLVVLQLPGSRGRAHQGHFRSVAYPILWIQGREEAGKLSDGRDTAEIRGSAGSIFPHEHMLLRSSRRLQHCKRRRPSDACVQSSHHPVVEDDHHGPQEVEEHCTDFAHSPCQGCMTGYGRRRGTVAAGCSRWAESRSSAKGAHG